MQLPLWMCAVEPLEPRVLFTTLYEIAPISDGCPGDSVPTDINDVGMVIGNCYVTEAGLSPSYAFTWNKQAGYQKLPGLDGVPNSVGLLSQDGRIAGGLSDPNRPYTTFVYDDNGIHPLDPEQLNPFYSYAIANFRGRTVVGPGLIASHRYLSVVQLFGGSHRSFGVPGGAKFVDVNNSGTVIVDGDGPEILDGSILRPLQELIVNLAGWRIVEAKAINDLGEIVGTGLYNAKLEAFILTPVSESSEPFPLGPNDSKVVWDVPEDWTPPDQPDDQSANIADDNTSGDATDSQVEDEEIVISADDSPAPNLFAMRSDESETVDDDLLASSDPVASMTSMSDPLH